jgi:uridine kinase
MGPHRDPVTDVVAVAVVAVTGPSAAGKTAPAQTLCSHLPGAVHLQQDVYFRDPDDYPPDANFCDHRRLHLDAFLDAFRALAASGTALVPDMDFATFLPRGHLLLGPARHLLVDGMTILRLPEIRRRCQHAIYLDPDFAAITARKHARDRRERNKPEAVIAAQLSWMREEHAADRALRDAPSIQVIKDSPSDITNLAHLILGSPGPGARTDLQATPRV